MLVCATLWSYHVLLECRRLLQRLKLKCDENCFQMLL